MVIGIFQTNFMNWCHSTHAAHSEAFSMFKISVHLQMVEVALCNLKHALKK